MRKYIFPIFVVGLVFLAAGCGKSEQMKNDFNKENRNFGSRNFASSTMEFPHTVGTIADLREGLKVVVSGKTNTDGTINATKIMIGELPMFNGQNNDRPKNTDGPRPQGEMPQRMNGQSRVIGEIFKMDESSLVIKEVKTGSKIVFYSDKTEIWVITPTPTSTFNGEVANTSTNTTT